MARPDADAEPSGARSATISGRADIVKVSLADGTVLFDPVTLRAHLLDPAASRIWAMLARPVTIDALVDRLGVGLEGVRQAVAHLAGEHLLAGGSPTVAPPDKADWRACDPSAAGARSVTVEMLERTVAFVDDGPGARERLEAVGWFAAPTRTREPAAEVFHLDTVDAALRTLPSRMNRLAARSDAFASLHAAGVVFGDAAVVLPAASGAGKSTLAAQLVLGGAGYLSDEVVGLALQHGVVSGYTKRISLELGAWECFGGADFDPALAERDGFDPTRVRWVDPRELNPSALVWKGRAVTPELIVVPRYEHGAALSVEPLTPFQAVAELLSQASNLADTGEAGVRALCDLARRTPGHRLVHSDARQAATAIRELLVEHGAPR